MSRKKPISIDPKSLSFQAVFSESDRGCVLTMAALLDKSLGKLHEVALTEKCNMFAKLSGSLFSPLYSFGGKIQLGYAYGLIDEVDFADLERIQKVRNEGAHAAFDFQLNNIGIKSVVKALTAQSRVKQMDIAMLDTLESSLKSIQLDDDSEVKRCFVLNGFALWLSLTRLRLDLEKKFKNTR